VNELLKAEHIEVAFKDIDPQTGRKVEFLRIKDREIIA
jgi:chemotaxis receptor (MCP) glutamine deamidase CheD